VTATVSVAPDRGASREPGEELSGSQAPPSFPWPLETPRPAQSSAAPLRAEAKPNGAAVEAPLAKKAGKTELTANRRAIDGQMTANRRAIDGQFDGQMTGNRRAIDGQLTGKLTANRRAVDGQIDGQIDGQNDREESLVSVGATELTAEMRLERLCPQELSLMLFAYQSCRDRCSLETAKLQSTEIAANCGINGHSPLAIKKNAIKLLLRLTGKGLLERAHSKTGPQGWVVLRMTAKIYEALKNVDSIGRVEPDNRRADRRADRRVIDGSVVGGVIYNLSPTTSERDDSENLAEPPSFMEKARKFDISRLAAFGFTYNALAKVIRSGKFGDDEHLQDSLDHMAYHLSKSGKGLHSPQLFIERTLIRDGSFQVPGFMGFQAEAADKYLDYLKQKRAAEEAKVDEVLGFMTPEELRALDREVEATLGAPTNETELLMRPTLISVNRRKVLLEKLRGGG
jgi:hypothetical protein